MGKIRSAASENSKMYCSRCYCAALTLLVTKNYPDNDPRFRKKESADAGIDVFRIFDSLNWLKGMEVAIDETLKQNKVCEACLCYTGDIMDASRDKYTLQYYVKMAKELEKPAPISWALKICLVC